MAKATITNVSNVSNVDLPRFCSINFEAIATQLNGNLEFGANVKASPTVVVFPSASQVVAVPHTLGRTPSGYLVIKQDVAGSVLTSESTNQWTASVIYLNASAAMTATLIIV